MQLLTDILKIEHSDKESGVKRSLKVLTTKCQQILQCESEKASNPENLHLRQTCIEHFGTKFIAINIFFMNAIFKVKMETVN